MNASGDRRYRRCKGLRDSFGTVKEKRPEPFVVAFEEELKIDIDRRLEKKEGGGDD
jgi:hypothetical protein